MASPASTVLQSKGAVIAIVGLAVVLGLVLILPAVKGVRDLTGGVGAVASNIGAGLGGLSSGVGSALGATGAVIGAPAEAISSSIRPLPDQNIVAPDDVVAGRPDLRLEALHPKNESNALMKKTAVTFRVTANGRPVPGALLTGRAVHRITKLQLGTQTLTTRGDGTVSAVWDVRNIPGTSGEDDMVWVATKSGYNPSHGVLVK